MGGRALEQFPGLDPGAARFPFGFDPFASSLTPNDTGVRGSANALDNPSTSDSEFSADILPYEHAAGPRFLRHGRIAPRDAPREPVPAASAWFDEAPGEPGPAEPRQHGAGDGGGGRGAPRAGSSCAGGSSRTRGGSCSTRTTPDARGASSRPTPGVRRDVPLGPRRSPGASRGRGRALPERGVGSLFRAPSVGISAWARGRAISPSRSRHVRRCSTRSATKMARWGSIWTRSCDGDEKPRDPSAPALGRVRLYPRSMELWCGDTGVSTTGRCGARDHPIGWHHRGRPVVVRRVCSPERQPRPISERSAPAPRRRNARDPRGRPSPCRGGDRQFAARPVPEDRARRTPRRGRGRRCGSVRP